MRYFSMFSGIGGFEYGIGDYGECIGYSENNKYAEAIYRYHYPEHRGYGDAAGIDTGKLPDYELLVGGFPCQSFSIAGNNKGFQDSRGGLFFEVARILSDKRPGYILLENVKGLLGHDGGKTFQTILGVLSDIGYVLQWEVLNSCNFGVPQHRERVYIIGCLGEGCFRQIFPICQNGRIFAKDNGGEWVSAGGGLAYSLDASYGKGCSVRSRTLICNNKQMMQGQRIYSPAGISVSVSTNGGGYGRQSGLYDINGIRRLTPLECERLQGFPDGWTEYGLFDEGIRRVSDTQRYNCLGNAVTTTVIRAIMQELARCLV